MANSKRVFFPSKWTRDLAESQIVEAIPQASYFQYPIRFRVDSLLPWPDSEVPRVAMVNRLDAFHKGIDLAFEAVARLMREATHIQLDLYGNGEDEDYLRKYSRFLGIQDAVVFHGYAANVEELWLREELLLLPSRFEGSAIALTEAMGFGRPVVTTPVGGASEWVEDGNTGYICAAPDVDLLTGTLRRALSERANWRAMGLKAHEKIKRQMDPKPGRVFLQAIDGRVVLPGVR
jgi:glycosyltransferase involved in cell wall biosynthesis